MSNKVLMAESLAIWLINNTKLTNEQISDFVGIDKFLIANYRVQKINQSIYDPVLMGMLEENEIKKCEQNPELSLKFSPNYKLSKKKTIDKNVVGSGILWIINEYPNVSNAQLKELFECSLSFIQSIKDKSYKHYDKLIFQNPLTLGLCNQKKMNEILGEKK